MTSPVSPKPFPITSPVSAKPLPITPPVSTKPCPTAPTLETPKPTTNAPPPTTPAPTFKSPSPTAAMSLDRLVRISCWKSLMISLSSPEAHSLANAPTPPLNACNSHFRNLNGALFTARIKISHSQNCSVCNSSVSFRFLRFSSSDSSTGFWFTRSNKLISAFSLFVTSAPAACTPPATALPNDEACLFTSASCFSISELADANESPIVANNDARFGSLCFKLFVAISAIRFSSSSSTSAASSRARSSAASSEDCRRRFWKFRIFFALSTPAAGSATSST
mmetsp:Transcript_8543/g.31984  ORF Transcript_8543/g.31984 Transcript_8543/m.31984 type:complete len:280 (-) Transcript_8543:549-1388(-)